MRCCTRRARGSAIGEGVAFDHIAQQTFQCCWLPATLWRAGAISVAQRQFKRGKSHEFAGLDVVELMSGERVEFWAR